MGIGGELEIKFLLVGFACVIAGKLRTSVASLLSTPTPETLTLRASARDEMIFPGVGNQRLSARTSRHFKKVMSDSMPETAQANPTSRNLSSSSTLIPPECRNRH